MKRLILLEAFVIKKIHNIKLKKVDISGRQNSKRCEPKTQKVTQAENQELFGSDIFAVIVYSPLLE
jgi:hypothetical protein